MAFQVPTVPFGDKSPQFEAAMQTAVGDQSNDDAGPPPSPQPLSKNAQKKLLKQQRFEAKKAEKKKAMKEHKKREGERKRKEWDQMLEGVTEEERNRLIDSRKGLRKERMEKRSEERENKIQRLTASKHHGQNIVVDFEFSHLMTTSEIHSLVQQVFHYLPYFFYSEYGVVLVVPPIVIRGLAIKL